MAEVSFSFRTDNFDKGIVFKGQRFDLQFNQEETGEYYKTAGIFYVDTVKIKGGKTSVVAYDSMSVFDVNADKFISTIEYPVTLYSLLQNLCAKAGIQLSNESITNGGINITKKISLSGGTLRNLLSYISATASCYAYINVDGELQLSEYKNTEINIDNTQYVSCWLGEYTTDIVERVTLSTPDAEISVDNPDINTSSETVNTYVIYDNPVINSCSDRTSIANGILEKIVDLSYTPSEIMLFRDYGINAGDIITVNGTKTIVMEKTMKPSGVTISATGNQSRDLYVSNEKQKSIQNNYDASTAKNEADSAVKTASETKESLSEYVKTSNLSASIDTYINSSSGTASIVAAVEGTYQKISDMSGYVQTSQISAKIGAYIDTAAGTSKIISAVSGTYQTISGMSNYATVKSVSTIEQSVSDVESAITLSSSYSENTIGTNVYALLQLVSNANSSSIKIKADKIDFTGFTTFLRASDLGSSGTTSIDGGRILTGTISADRIDTSDIYLQQLRTKSGEYIIDYYSNVLSLGGGTSGSGHSFAAFDYTDIMVEKGIRIGYGSYNCMFSYESTHFVLRPYSSPTQLDIGSSTYPVGYIYSKYNIYVDGVAVATKNDIPDTLSATDVKAIYAVSSTSNNIQLNSSKVFVPSGTGFSIGSSSYPFQTIYVGTGSSYYWKIEAGNILPSSTSTSYFNIGSSSYPVNNLYAQSISATSITLNGTALKTGSSFAGSDVTMGGSTSYYIICNTNRQLRPSNSSTSYPCYLGTSGIYWHYAYIGSNTTSIGNSTSSKLGFFGKTPVSKQTPSTSSTHEQLLSALISYGLV